MGEAQYARSRDFENENERLPGGPRPTIPEAVPLNFRSFEEVWL
jgi:hypothetical protein